MKISPEARFVTSCVRSPSAARDADLPQQAALVADWGRVNEIAESHFVGQFVDQAASLPVAVMPQWARQTLRQTLLAQVAETLFLDSVLGALVEALAERGAEPMVLKGPAVARTVYPDPVLRPYGDIDLAVRPEHQEAARSTLADMGFSEVAESQAARGIFKGTQEIDGLNQTFVSADGCVVDLHGDVLQLGLTPECETDRWARSEECPGLPGARILAAPDMLVQLAVHAHIHGFSRLIWLKDIDLLVRVGGGSLDWALIIDTAQREGVSGSVWYSLRLTQGILGTPLYDVLAQVQPALPVRLAYHSIWPTSRIAALRGFSRRRAVQFTASESWPGMVPSLMLMGRRSVRARSIARWAVGR